MCVCESSWRLFTFSHLIHLTCYLIGLPFCRHIIHSHTHIHIHKRHNYFPNYITHTLCALCLCWKSENLYKLVCWNELRYILTKLWRHSVRFPGITEPQQFRLYVYSWHIFTQRECIEIICFKTRLVDVEWNEIWFNFNCICTQVRIRIRSDLQWIGLNRNWKLIRKCWLFLKKNESKLKKVRYVLQFKRIHYEH